MTGFDLETTSPDPEAARIVTAAITWRSIADQRGTDQAWLIDPGAEIPAEATAIHGITTEHARANGAEPSRALAEICEALAAIMRSRVPLVIYNAPYDLTVLDRETRRHGLEPFGDALHAGIFIIDPFVLDKHVDPYRKGRRTLTAACEHYKVALDGAHDAGADALAAMRVAWKIAASRPDIAAMRAGELHELQVRAKAKQAAGFQDYLRRQGNAEVVDGSWPWRHYEEVA